MTADDENSDGQGRRVGRMMHAPAPDTLMWTWLQDGALAKASGVYYTVQSNHITIAMPLPRLEELRAIRMVLEMPEIVEEILMLLPTPDVLHARRVCRRWRAIVIGSKRLAALFYFTDRPIDPPASELAIMPYRNLGLRITRVENLLDGSTESCPYLDIHFSYESFLRNSRTAALHRSGPDRSDFLRAVRVSHPSPKTLIAYRMCPPRSLFTTLACRCQSPATDPSPPCPMPGGRAVLLGDIIDAADRQGFRCIQCRLFCDVVVEAGF